MSETQDQAGPSERFERTCDRLRQLYHGRTPAALRFQFATLIVDLLIIGFFIATPLLRDRPAFLWLDYTVATIVLIEIVARMLAASNIPRLLRQSSMLLDLFILATLLAPQWLENFGFLRILRLWSLSQRGLIWSQLRETRYREWENVARALINLVTFLFVVTGFVYTFFFMGRPGIDGYVEALYFTVATVTTTGFGDITLPGIGGKLTSIVVMIVGISLFVRLAQAVFRPQKVTFPCPQCALQRHEPDAVHCKACGHILKIPDHDD
ncbi:potassium channel family protein [Bosea sp. (in: a-proteobacteria)]|uniref:potassium channel family protein n=1 Tax=Bosea sp. (in: a-proteobacteria) TaxID=1871050 RepID=UPI001AD4CD13|nr:potassium channel family protein [Bosea sp. (in: a-proteobacteria)]MBN9439989.1 potassium channel family protein [Bosea sp. (in: a-proteobacteria)]